MCKGAIDIWIQKISEPGIDEAEVLRLIQFDSLRNRHGGSNGPDQCSSLLDSTTP
jgi:hypothetical protein